MKPSTAWMTNDDAERDDHRVQRGGVADEPHHGPLDEDAEDHPGHQRGGEAEPEAAGVQGHRDGDVRASHRHRTLGEVHDPGGPPDQHERQRERGVDRSLGQAVDGQEDEAVHPCSLSMRLDGSAAR